MIAAFCYIQIFPSCAVSSLPRPDAFFSTSAIFLFPVPMVTPALITLLQDSTSAIASFNARSLISSKGFSITA